MECGGIVLCGGQSLRMGRSKAWLPFDDELMLQRVVRIVQQAVSPTFVVAAPGQDLPFLPKTVKVVCDANEERGPLQGLATGLAAIESQCDAVFLSSCDVPFLKPDFVRFVVDQLRDNLIAVPLADGLTHPLTAAYRVGVLPIILELLASNTFRMSSLFERCRTRFVLSEQLMPIDPSLRSLWNLNTPDDYDSALRYLSSGSNVFG